MTEPTRKIARQATSVVAHVAPEPEEDDPLLAFAPFLHTAPRRNSITPALQRRFVATLAATGIVKVAAKRIGKSLEALYKLRARPGAEGFAGAWDTALERGAARLEDMAMERALLGTRTPIVSGGEILGHWDKPDNALLRFLLAHRLPARYGPQAREVGPGHPVWEELAAQARAEVAEIKRTMQDEVAARAIALQTFRRRRLWRQRQAAGARAGDITMRGRPRTPRASRSCPRGTMPRCAARGRSWRRWRRTRRSDRYAQSAGDMARRFSAAARGRRSSGRPDA